MAGPVIGDNCKKLLLGERTISLLKLIHALPVEYHGLNP